MSPGLYELEDTFLDGLRQDLRASGMAKNDVASLTQSSKIHLQMLQGCPAQFSVAECKTERLLEDWERSMSGIRNDLQNAWQATTGVRARSSDGYISLEGSPTFRFILEPAEAKSLSLRFGPDPLTGSATVNSDIGQLLLVKDEATLGASAWLVVPKTQPLQTAIAAIVALIIIGTVVWTKATSPDSMATFEIFNLALTSGHERWWEIASRRRGEWMVREFGKWCSTFGKPTIKAKAEQPFEYVRRRLALEQALYDLNFQDKQELEHTMRRLLRELALRA